MVGGTPIGNTDTRSGGDVKSLVSESIHTSGSVQLNPPTQISSIKGGIPSGCVLAVEQPPTQVVMAASGTTDSHEGATSLDYSSVSPGLIQNDRNNPTQPQGNIDLEEIDVDATDIVPVSIQMTCMIKDSSLSYIMLYKPLNS